MTTVLAARNLAHNPRPTSTTNVTGTGGTTITLVTDRSFSGSSSLLVTIPAGGWIHVDAAATGDLDLTGIPSASTLHAAIHVSGPVPASVVAGIILIYTDATSSIGATVPVTNASTRFERVIPTPITATAGKVINNLLVRITNNGGSPATFYIGGFDFRRGAAVDGFIHGAGGANYSWEGTANNSPSNRAQFTTDLVQGSGGSVYPSIKLFVVNRQNQILREITDHFIDGDVTYDLDAATWKGSCRLVLDDPTLIQPLALEFVRIVLHLDYPDGTSEEGSIGQFMVDMPSERWSSGDDQWTYQGRDMLALLNDTMFPDGNVVAAGAAYQAQLNQILLEVIGLSPSQISIPAITQVWASDFSWEEGTTTLQVITDTLVAAGMQKPWITPTGQITSAVAGTSPANISPSVVLATGEDSPLRWPFQVDPDTAKIGNRVHVISVHSHMEPTPPTVIGQPDALAASFAGAAYNPSVEEEKKKKKKHKHKGRGNQPGPDPDPDPTDIPQPDHNVDDPIAATAVNDDPAHPISHVRLGRWIDLPNINVPQVSGQAEAQAIADQALLDASVLPMIARVTTRVMLRGLNEVYELDMFDSIGNPIDSGQGRYFCRGWTLQLGLPWEMVHTLKRVIAFSSTAFFS